jgi:hypothetical protein
MRLTTFLVFDRRKVIGVRKGNPNLSAGEYAVKLHLDVPDSLFKDLHPTVTIGIPERAVFAPTVEVVSPPTTEETDDG